MEQSSAETLDIARIRRMFNRGDFEGVLRECEKTRERSGLDELVLELEAETLNLVGRHKEALELYRKLMEQDPKRPEYLFGYGFSLYGQGEFGDAKSCLKKVLEQNPSMAQASVLLARCLEKSGEVRSALEVIALGEKRFRGREDESSTLSMFSYIRGKCSLREGKRPEARQHFRDAIAKWGFNHAAYSALRKLNPRATVLAKTMLLTVRGLTGDAIDEIPAGYEFMCTYELVAETKAQALDFIQEIETVADPLSLEIDEIRKSPLRSHDQHLGVVMRYPSMSFEEPGEAPRKVEKNLH